MGADLTISVRLSPKASRNAVGKWFHDEKNKPILKVSVTSVPEKGRANEALIELLSEHWNIQKHRLCISRGLTDRNKILIIKDISEFEREDILKGL